MNESFGTLPSGQEASLYTLTCGSMTAAVTDYGATLVRLLVPDAQGNRADVVLGYDDCNGYRLGDACFGATVGRNANRIKDATFPINGRPVRLTPNEGRNNLHSGPDHFHRRLWQVTQVSENAITFRLDSPNGDQGFPGNATIYVTYSLEPGMLRIRYQGICDQDTVFNMTNHSYFNLAGHENTAAAMNQILTIPGRFFNTADEESIPTGEKRSVAGTPMDFRTPTPIGQRINEDYEPLALQKGYDHNWEVFCSPCAILRDPQSGRIMTVTTDCPGVQFYSGNFTNEIGKDGVRYSPRSGVALETQYYPDAVNHPEWPQPITRAGQTYRSETCYAFHV